MYTAGPRVSLTITGPGLYFNHFFCLVRQLKNSGMMDYKDYYYKYKQHDPQYCLKKVKKAEEIDEIEMAEKG